MTKKPELSIVILSYNTRKLLRDCLLSLDKVKNEAEIEIIVVDNASSDGSPEMLETDFSEVKLVKNDRNLGFAAGNNRARQFCRGNYVLFLNSDTVVGEGTIRESLTYLKSHPEVGVLTCKIILANGGLDKDARRSFILCTCATSKYQMSVIRSSELLCSLAALFEMMQAAVIVLNNRGWVGYLVAHETNPKLYCHFHYQENMDGELLISNARTLVWYGVFRMFRALFFKRWNCST